MDQLKCKFCIERGSYRFETKSIKDSFLEHKKLNFEFDLDNFDDPEEALSAFGVQALTPIFNSNEQVIEIIEINEDRQDELCCIVSASVELEFPYTRPLESVKKWLEKNGDDFNICGRISCEGEDGLDGSELEGFVWPWDL